MTDALETMLNDTTRISTDGSDPLGIALRNRCARDEVVEECAQVCLFLADCLPDEARGAKDQARRCARSIRALARNKGKK